MHVNYFLWIRKALMCWSAAEERLVKIREWEAHAPLWSNFYGMCIHLNRSLSWESRLIQNQTLLGKLEAGLQNSRKFSMFKCKTLNFSRENELNKYKTDRKLLGSNSSNKALREKKRGGIRWIQEAMSCGCKQGEHHAEIYKQKE